MKKNFRKLLSLLVCFSLVLSIGGMFSVKASAAPPSNYNYNQAKMITLTFSQCVEERSGSLYVKDGTKFDWSLLSDTDINGVVIIPYIADPYSPSGDQWWDIENKGLEYNAMATLMSEVIKKVSNADSSLAIWFGTPEIDHASVDSATVSKCLDKFTNYVSAVKSKVGTTIWNNQIKGVYYAQESVYGTLDYSNVINNNPQVFLMSSFAYRVHTNFQKDLLWIPYYGYDSNAATVIKNMGYVANTTPIFDCVIIQPHYEIFGDMTPGPLENITAAKQSVLEQEICYRNDVPVVARNANATAVIGVELEHNYGQGSGSRINTYTSYLGGFVGSKPVVYYWQGIDVKNLSQVKAKVNSVF